MRTICYPASGQCWTSSMSDKCTVFTFSSMLLILLFIRASFFVSKTDFLTNIFRTTFVMCLMSNLLQLAIFGSFHTSLCLPLQSEYSHIFLKKKSYMKCFFQTHQNCMQYLAQLYCMHVNQGRNMNFFNFQVNRGKGHNGAEFHLCSFDCLLKWGWKLQLRLGLTYFKK